ncbi:uncharacterized protein ACHE_20423S [Aspergillus chevalieri]|uniref:Uncharacterized protein n=1 Tax=Aspergillus chevalieri TaxID=182096 RepID=A0A7R7ZJS0_ASPCH|nr:uncharacterized protein ACHE_20423S [Aspergillus chevalieri]BCR84965.1 hypothetical protein ACHE_20423S [Aspergillus chevalieri]
MWPVTGQAGRPSSEPFSHDRWLQQLVTTITTLRLKFDIEEKELAFIRDYAKTDGIAALQEAKVQQSSIDSADLISDDEEDEIDDVSQPTVLLGEDSTASKRQSSVLSEDSASEDESLLPQVLAKAS